jgi:hypothetical protein
MEPTNGQGSRRGSHFDINKILTELEGYIRMSFVLARITLATLLVPYLLPFDPLINFKMIDNADRVWIYNGGENIWDNVTARGNGRRVLRRSGGAS